MIHSSLALIPDFDLSAHNTLALGARSRLGVSVTEPGMVPEVLAEAAARGLALRILGGGSNVVLAPDFDGITAVMAIRGRRIVETNERGVLVEAAAAEPYQQAPTVFQLPQKAVAPGRSV